MRLPDGGTSASELVSDLPLAAMVVSLVLASFFVGAIVGAEAIAAGQPVFPPRLLPGVVWSGQATDRFLVVYEAATTALWVCAAAVLATTAVATLYQSE